MYPEFMLGFDCREMRMPESEPKNWQDKSGLMNPDVERILTINRMDWFSVFLPSGQKFSDRTAPGYSLAVLPEWTTENGFWRDLDAMREFMASHKEHYQKRSWMIGLSVVQTPEYLHGQKNPDESVPPIEDIAPASEWTLLGYDYDVEDSVFFHGGLNMRWIEEYERERRELWGPRLNQYYLFPQQKDAIEYAAYHEKVKPGFGLLLVYGIYLIQEFPSK